MQLIHAPDVEQDADLGATSRDRLTTLPHFQRALLDALADGVFVLDSAGCCVEVNAAFCRLIGLTRGELLGSRAPFPFWPEEHETALAAAFREERRCAETRPWARERKGDSAQGEHTFRKRDGTSFTVQIDHAVMRDGAGIPAYLVATVKDLSREKQLELALKRSEQTWRSIAENPHEFVSILDRDRRFVYRNRSEIHGIDAEDLLAEAEICDALERAFRDGTVATVESFAPATRRWHANVITPIREDGVVTLVSVLTRDITDQKRALDALWRSERSLQLALSAGDFGTFEWDPCADKWSYSPRVYEIWGYEAGSPDIPHTLAEIDARVHPDDRGVLRSCVSAGTQPGGSVNFEYRFVDAHGNYRWNQTFARCFADADGTIRTYGLVGDVTDRKQAELEQERFQTRLRHAQKMDTLGTLAGGIAHDFNNLLMPILGNVGLLQKRVASDSPLSSALSGIHAAAQRAQQLVARILVFGRAHEEERQAVDLAAVAREALQLLSTSMPPSIDVCTEIDADCPAIDGWPGQVHQAIMNLCTNGYQALRESGGQLLLQVARAEVAPEFFEIHGLRPGPLVKVVVQDDGAGIPARLQERIFEPFFTTKRVGEGTGLGLAMVHTIVKQHGGTVLVHSEPGQGARFELYFPVGDRPRNRVAREHEAQTNGHAAALRVLCVDDDLAVLAALEAMLWEAGHVPVCLGSPRDALARLEADPAAFDLVITDYSMPQLTGIEFARGALALRGDLPVLLMSGYADIHGIECRPRNIRRVLQKPMTFQAFLEAVQSTV